MLLRRLLPGASPSSPSSLSSPFTSIPSSLISSLLLLSALAAVPAHAGDVLETNGFSTCLNTDDIVVNQMNVQYDKAQSHVAFNLAGVSKKEQKVMAVLTVEAYGKQVYQKEFDPCKEEIKELCPSTVSLW